MAHVAARPDSKTEKPSRLNFEERVAWTESNIQRIRAISDAVRREVVPAGVDQIDDPVQFIAACHELVQALDDDCSSWFNLICKHGAARNLTVKVFRCIAPVNIASQARLSIPTASPRPSRYARFSFS
jgi:hypothetical protein